MLDKAFTEAVKAWHDLCGDAECTRANGRTQLVKCYLRSYPRKSEYQASKSVTLAVCKVRGIIMPSKTKPNPNPNPNPMKIRGIIKPQRTKKGFRQKQLGAATSRSVEESKRYNAHYNPIWNPIWHPLWNPINGPIERAKQKKLRIQRDLEYLRDHPEAGRPLSDEDLLALVNDITCRMKLAGFGDKTISELIESREIVVYFGINITYYYLFLVIIL